MIHPQRWPCQSWSQLDAGLQTMDEGANLLCYLMAALPVETENARHLPPLAIDFQRSGVTQERRGNGLTLA